MAASSAPPTLASMVTEESQSDVFADLDAQLKNPQPLADGTVFPPLPTTSWEPGSVPLTLLWALADSLADETTTRSNLAQGGFLLLASNPELQYTQGPRTGTSPWVDLLAQNWFNLTRASAQATLGAMSFRCTTVAQPIAVGALVSDAQGNVFVVMQAGVTPAASAWQPSTPYVISPAASVVRDPATGNLWQCLMPGTSGSGTGSPATPFTPAPMLGQRQTDGTVTWVAVTSAVQLTVTAQQPGAAGNIPAGQTLQLNPALPGVTVTNPIGPSGTWYSQAGSNLESDASLVQRCVNQWSTQGTGSPGGAWLNWAQAASNEVRYALARATGMGTVLVTVYGDGAQVSQAGLDAIAAYINLRAPLGSTLALGQVMNARGVTLLMRATLFGPASANPAALAAAAAALQALIKQTPVGGFPIAPGSPDTYGISAAQIIDAIVNAYVVQGQSAITRVALSVSNDGGTTYVDFADFVMPDRDGTPVIVQAPALEPGQDVWAPFGLAWQNV